MADAWTTMGGDGGRFPLTRWSLIRRAGGAPGDERTTALNELLSAYWKPLYAFLRSRGADNETAKDRVQGFFVSLLERDLLDRFDPAKGKFRTFLLTCFERWCADAYDAERAAKRGGGAPVVRLDVRPEDDTAVAEVQARGGTPADHFLAMWAREKMARALSSMRARLLAAGDLAGAHVFEGYLEADNPARPGYAALAARSGLDESAVRHKLEKLRRGLREALLDEVRAEVRDDAEAEEELAALMGALGKAG